MKKLTKEKLYEIMDNFVAADSIYRELLPYLADEQQAEKQAKPEPSRLEVAAILANGLGYQYGHANEYLDMADELIKQSRL